MAQVREQPLRLLAIEAGSARVDERLQIAPRVREVAPAQIRAAALEPRSQQIGLDVERLAECAGRLGELAALEPDHAEAVPDVARLGQRSSPELGDRERLVAVAPAPVQIAERHVRRRLPRMLRDRLAELLRGALRVAEIAQDAAEVVVR